MIGQNNLLNKLKSYTLQTLPHTLLFLGENGCGKHTLSNELSNYFNIKLIDITNNITLETIEEIYLNVMPYFYLIDMTKLNEKQQNMILKLIEEPNNLTYIILLSENKLNLLNTIINRCMTFEFEKYSIEELKHFTQEENIKLFELCSTPGQIQIMNIKKLDELYNLCDAILTKISLASFPNILTIVNKINYSEDFDKFDFNIFFKALIIKSLYLFKENKIIKPIYDCINEYYKKSKYNKLNKNYLTQSMLIELWLLSKNNV